MDWTTLIYGIIALTFLGVFGYLGNKAISNGHIQEGETNDIIYTTDQILNVVYVMLKALSPDEKIINTIYYVLGDLLEFAKDMVEADSLDKQYLIDETYEQLGNLGIVLENNQKTIIEGIVELVYTFVSR